MTTKTHAAPWTVRRFLAQFSPAPRKPRVDVLTGREAAARALYFEAVGGSKLDMLNYDATPHLRAVWLVAADRRIASAPSIPDLHIPHPRSWEPAARRFRDLTEAERAEQDAPRFEADK